VRQRARKGDAYHAVCRRARLPQAVFLLPREKEARSAAQAPAAQEAAVRVRKADRGPRLPRAGPGWQRHAFVTLLPMSAPRPVFTPCRAGSAPVSYVNGAHACPLSAGKRCHVSEAVVVRCVCRGTAATRIRRADVKEYLALAAAVITGACSLAQRSYSAFARGVDEAAIAAR